MSKLSPTQLKRKLEPLEHNQQVSIFEWADRMSKKYPELKLLNGSLNGVRLTPGQAKKAKASGMKKGFPDINLPVERNGWHGLYIELKRQYSGSLSKEQIWWLEQLIDNKYYAVCCRGKEHTIKTILEYLNGNL